MGCRSDELISSADNLGEVAPFAWVCCGGRVCGGAIVAHVCIVVLTLHGLVVCTAQADYHGVLNIIHELLHGAPMGAVAVDNDTARIVPSKPFRRFWQLDLWTRLFDDLLNTAPGEQADVAKLREGFETYFARNPFKAKSLKNSLVKQDIKLFEYRD